MLLLRNVIFIHFYLCKERKQVIFEVSFKSYGVNTSATATTSIATDHDRRGSVGNVGADKTRRRAVLRRHHDAEGNVYPCERSSWNEGGHRCQGGRQACNLADRGRPAAG